VVRLHPLLTRIDDTANGTSSVTNQHNAPGDSSFQNGGNWSNAYASPLPVFTSELPAAVRGGHHERRLKYTYKSST
jgi:hypothetical protein